MKQFIAAIVFGALALMSDRAFAQANIIENQTTYIYVNAATGLDSNRGDIFSQPLKTIQAATERALTNNGKGIGTKIYISPGVYREFINVHGASQRTTAPISFNGANGVIIDGADVVTGWQQLSTNEYVSPWTDTVAGCSAPSSWPVLPPIVMSSEMIFVNGTPMTQILDPADQREGTFYVDAANQALHLFPPAGTDMTSALVEVAARRNTLDVNGRRFVAFHRIAFQHAASCVSGSGANVYNSDNILFDHVRADWNNWGGMTISNSSNVTVQNSAATHNGGLGFGVYQTTGALYQANETSYNNWRGAMGAFYDFGMGGTKFMLTHAAQVNRQMSYRNQAHGLWFDTDNKNIAVTGARLSENMIANLKLEANQGPFTVQGSSFCSSGSGMMVINTAGITVNGSNFYNNGGTSKWQGAFFLGGSAAGRAFTDWQTGQPYVIQTSNVTLASNIYTNASVGQSVFSTYLSGTPWSTFTSTLHSDQNTYYDATVPTPFLVPGGHYVGLSGWQNVAGQDQNSSWSLSKQAAQNCTVPSVAYPDFYLNANNRENASVPVWAAPYPMSGGIVTVPLQVQSFGMGPVTLSTSALPAGVTATFSAPSLASGPSVLTVQASLGAVAQTLPVTVFATSGSRVHSVTIPVAIAP